MKKILSLLLLLCFIIPLCSFSAAAADPAKPYAVVMSDQQLLIFFDTPDAITIAPRSGANYWGLRAKTKNKAWAITPAGASTLQATGASDTFEWLNDAHTVAVYTLSSEFGALANVLAGNLKSGDKTWTEWFNEYPTDGIMFGLEVSGTRTWIPVVETTPFAVTSAVALNDTQIQINFNRAIGTMYGAQSGGTAPYVGLRLLGANGLLADAGAVGGTAQFWGNVAYTDAEKTSLIWTIDPSFNKTVTSLLDGSTGAWTQYLANTPGSSIALVIEESSSVMSGFIENISDANGMPLTGNKTGSVDRLNLSVAPYDDGTTDVRVVSATVISTTQVRVEFSESVEFSGAPLLSLRIVDADDVLQYTSEESPKAVQLTGTWKYEDDTKTSVLWQTQPGVALTDFVNRTGAYAEYAAFLAKFCLEETGTTLVNGKVDNILSTGGGKLAAGNSPLTNIKENLYVTLSDDDRPALEALSATRISNNEFLIEFSAAVDIAGSPFIGLRIVNENNVLQDGKQLWNGDWSYADQTKTRIIWRCTDSKMADFIALTGDYADYAAFETKLCIEEKRTDGELETAGNGLVENITKADGRALTANKPVTGTAYDGVYLSITEDPRTPLTVESVTAFKETQLRITFSEPVNITGNPLLALRIVDANNQLVRIQEGDRTIGLQYFGAWAFEDDTKKTIIWTANNKNMLEILDLSGNFAQYDTDGNRVMFVIEELREENVIDTLGNGQIENITGAEGRALSANVISYSTAYDALCTEVAQAIEWPEPRVIRAVAIDARQVVIEFSQPVKIVDGNPFMAIRYCNDNNVLQYEQVDGKNKALQFGGTFRFVDGTGDRIVWTAAAGVGDVRDIINRTGDYAKYSDYAARFCIEELLADGEDKEDGTIHNIVSIADGARLYANRVATGKNYDGSYTPIIIDETYTIPDTADRFSPLFFSGLAMTGITGMAVVWSALKKRKSSEFHQ